MTQLVARGQTVETVFDLLGNNENAMTYSLGWALARCNGFGQSLAALLGIPDGFSDAMHIRLQDHQQEKGFTDIEMVDPGKHHIIIEAKRGFVIPGIEQLEKYADRLLARVDNNAKPLLVVLAESDRDEKWLKLHVPNHVKGIPVLPISWRRFQNMAQGSIIKASHEDKRLLRQLIQYLEKVTTMQNQFSNMVYVVALGDWESAVGDVTNIELVEKYRRYFHPVGGSRGGWPVEPPNYFGFRYHGSLKGIYHVEKYSVISDFKVVLPGKPGNGEVEPHYLYELGQPILPAKPVSTNDKENRFPQIVRSARKWCFIDLLLTCDSISEAAYKSRQRENIQEAA